VRVIAVLLDITIVPDVFNFEDNLQVACAVLTRLDAIVTRDPRGFAGSPVPVLAPARLLAQIPKGGGA
jgi:hypothetical protein